MENVIEKNEINNISEKEKFLNSIKYSEYDSKIKLLKIQKELVKMGINKENIALLTKDLSEDEKQKLEDLYEIQINQLNSNIENYKNKIIKIRRKYKISNS